MAVAVALSVPVAVAAPAFGSTSRAGGKGLAGAQAFLKKWSKNPTTLQVSTPLTKTPPTGKFVIRVDAPLPVVEAKSAAEAEAAKVLGWKYQLVSIQPTADSTQAGFESAIALKPDAIIFAGAPASILTKQIDDAHKAGIAVISDNTPDGVVPNVIGNLNGNSQEVLFAKEMAAYFVTDSKGHGHAVLYNVSAYPIIGAYIKSFKSAVKQWCSGCKLTVVDQQASGIGTTTPQDAVSQVQRDPSIKYVFFAGDFYQGVAAALQAAGLSDVHVGSVGQEQPAGLKSATAISGYSVPVLGWAVMDALARNFTGDPVDPALKASTPTQIITKSNIKKVTLDSSGFYIGVRNYQAEFKRLWKL